MRAVFADTAFWVALTNREDDDHAEAVRQRDSLQGVILVTTFDVLDEYLAFFSGMGENNRQAAVLVRGLLEQPDVEVVPQSRELFLKGLGLYEARLDKEYSLTDCISMCVMTDRVITEVLTTDHHFTQAGFTILLPRKF